MPYVDGNSRNWECDSTEHMELLKSEKPNGSENGQLDRDHVAILKGSTKFEPNPEVHNIMITGAAGFMSVSEVAPCLSLLTLM